MNCMVTGGAGFIGSHVVEALLEKGAVVTVFDDLSFGKRENLAAAAMLCTGDVRDKRAVGAAVAGGVDYVFHLAAQIDVRKAVEDPGLDAQVNVGGTINVLNVCVASHVRRFVMSSAGGATAEHGMGTGQRAQQHFVDRAHQAGCLVRRSLDILARYPHTTHDDWPGAAAARGGRRTAS